MMNRNLPGCREKLIVLEWPVTFAMSKCFNVRIPRKHTTDEWSTYSEHSAISAHFFSYVGVNMLLPLLLSQNIPIYTGLVVPINATRQLAIDSNWTLFPDQPEDMSLYCYLRSDGLWACMEDTHFNLDPDSSF